MSISRRIGCIPGLTWLSRMLAATFSIGLSLMLGASSAETNRTTLVTYPIKYISGSLQQDVPVTFGAVFVDGAVPSGATISATDGAGRSIPLQVDVKARHADGSLRHAVLTASFPHLRSGSNDSLKLLRGPNPQGASIAPADLPQDLDASVTLTSNGTKLTASHETRLRPGPARQ